MSNFLKKHIVLEEAVLLFNPERKDLTLLLL